MTGHPFADRALLAIGIFGSLEMLAVVGLAVWANVVARREGR